MTKQRNTVWFAAAGLIGIAVLSALLVSVTAHLTRARIADNRAAQIMRLLDPLLPAGEHDNMPYRDTTTAADPDRLGSAIPQTIYRARKGDTLVAAVLTVTAPAGYVDPIRLLVAIDRSGQVLGVRPLEHRETPGLGDRIEPARSGWIKQFAGRSLTDPSPEDWAVQRDGGQFDQISGATITSRAVVSAVHDALVWAAENPQIIDATAAVPR